MLGAWIASIAAVAMGAVDGGRWSPDGGAPVAPNATAPAARVMPTPIATSYPNVATALHVVLGRRPRVLAVGEYHQTTATAGIPSALRRFTREVLPELREAGATELVVETWVTTGSCGEVEKQAVAEVAKATARPKQTESEVVTLLRRAKAAGIEPGILEVGCADYRAMTAGPAVDYERLLRLTRAQLEKQIRAALARPGSRMVVSYGGALHNDFDPTPDLAPYSFGPAVARSVGGSYVELDLVVPELVEKNASLRAQPWFGAYRRAYRPGRVTLVSRGDASFVLVFPRRR